MHIHTRGPGLAAGCLQRCVCLYHPGANHFARRRFWNWSAFVLTRPTVPTVSQLKTAFLTEAEPDLVSLSQEVLRRQRHIPKASQHLADVAATDPGALQTFLVGAALLLTVGAAVFNGLKGEPRVCDLCQGTGGTRCFGCGASGRMPQLAKDQPQKRPKRDLIGRRPADPTVCRVCKGTGLVMCSRCKGSGYLSGM